MERWKIVMCIGAAIALIGGWPAINGTTSMGLYVFSGIMILVGIGVATYGKKLRDQR